MHDKVTFDVKGTERVCLLGSYRSLSWTLYCAFGLRVMQDVLLTKWATDNFSEVARSYWASL
jgi:hypothetical protein